MTSYRRILVPIVNNLHSNGLLHTLLDTIADAQSQVIILRLVEYHSGFVPDGPAANLPEEIAVRHAAAAKRHLESQLVRMGLDWVESRVIWRNPQSSFLKIVEEWHPDLIIARRGTLPETLPEGIDILNTSGQGFFERLSDVFSLHVPKHA